MEAFFVCFKTGGVFVMTFFLGCDVSKNKVDLALIDATGAQQWADQMPIAIALPRLVV
jgi:hypothetical protein